ncbi:MAG: tetratricopeptide repeat protein [Bacteroidetes bacterium]|nr:tetratricopeptide repeat protein [Bacteroidota bacterium]
MKKVLFSVLILLVGSLLQAQDQLHTVAKQYLQSGQYEKAAATYKQLLEYNPNNESMLLGYLESLNGLRDYKTAEKILKDQMKQQEGVLKYRFELGKIYTLQGEEKKAKKTFDAIVDEVKPGDEGIRNTASLFQKEGLYDYAIAVFEKGKGFNKENPFLFAEELALLFDKKGDTEKATESLLDLFISRSEKAEEIKATFQRLFDNGPKLEEFRKKVQKRATSNPDIVAYPDLLAWLYMQQKDYESAFTQIKAIDIRFNEQGRRAFGFARLALREKEFKAAVTAYDFVISKGKEEPYFVIASSEKLTCLKEQLKFNPHYTKGDVELLGNAYEVFLTENPSFKQRETLREYAELEARYAHNIEKAISLLSEITQAKNVDAVFRGRCKLEMGDYELVRNNIWESTLLYSQVDKEFKRDMLGEEARYKNAKLSYYTGDFVWAQGQLDVLKASTSELIANDALNLSVLITENNPVADSNTTPLLLFANADLLEFQNKDQEAILKLDSIELLFPKHPLQDNILMMRAEIAYKKQDYSEAALHLQKITTQYAEDVLADDALFNLAYINETFFSNKDEAKRLYEQLILKYPGSTFVNEARKRFRILRGDKADVETPKNF